MAKGKNQFVNPHPGGGWEVKGQGNTKATVVKERKADAVDIARQIAKNQESELTIKDQHGRIQEKNSYGNDPCPPKDKD